MEVAPFTDFRSSVERKLVCHTCWAEGMLFKMAAQAPQSVSIDAWHVQRIVFWEPCRKNIGLQLVQHWSIIGHKSYFGQLGVASYAPFCFSFVFTFGLWCGVWMSFKNAQIYICWYLAGIIPKSDGASLKQFWANLGPLPKHINKNTNHQFSTKTDICLFSSLSRDTENFNIWVCKRPYRTNSINK